jgi:hypothetical protein
MVYVEGAESCEEVSEIVATQPPEGAGMDMPTVQLAENPGMRVVGVQPKDVIWKPLVMVREIVLVLDPMAVITAV